MFASKSSMFHQCFINVASMSLSHLMYMHAFLMTTSMHQQCYPCVFEWAKSLLSGIRLWSDIQRKLSFSIDEGRVYLFKINKRLSVAYNPSTARMPIVIQRLLLLAPSQKNSKLKDGVNQLLPISA